MVNLSHVDTVNMQRFTKFRGYDDIMSYTCGSLYIYNLAGIHPSHGSDGRHHKVSGGRLVRSVGRADETVVAVDRASRKEAFASQERVVGRAGLRRDCAGTVGV